MNSECSMQNLSCLHNVSNFPNAFVVSYLTPSSQAFLDCACAWTVWRFTLHFPDQPINIGNYSNVLNSSVRTFSWDFWHSPQWTIWQSERCHWLWHWVIEYGLRSNCHERISFLLNKERKKKKMAYVVGIAKRKNTFEPNFPIMAMTLLSRCIALPNRIWWTICELFSCLRKVFCIVMVLSHSVLLSFRKQKTVERWLAMARAPVNVTKHSSKLRVWCWILIDIFGWNVTHLEMAEWMSTKQLINTDRIQLIRWTSLWMTIIIMFWYCRWCWSVLSVHSLPRNSLNAIKANKLANHLMDDADEFSVAGNGENKPHTNRLRMRDKVHTLRCCSRMRVHFISLKRLKLKKKKKNESKKWWCTLQNQKKCSLICANSCVNEFWLRWAPHISCMWNEFLPVPSYAIAV